MSINNGDNTKLKKELQELTQIRKSLLDTEKLGVIQKLLDRLSKIIDVTPKRNINTKESTNITLKVNELDKEIEKIESSLKKYINDYDESYKQMKKLVEEKNSKLEGDSLLSEEELEKLRTDFLTEQFKENENSISIKNIIREEKCRIKALKKQKKKIEECLEKEKELELSNDEIERIRDILEKEEILEAILATKGFTGNIDLDFDEYKEECNKIIQEVDNYKKNNKKTSILDVIEALYSLNLEYLREEEPKPLVIDCDDLDAIQNNADEMPEKIVGKEPKNENKPTKAPTDIDTSELELFTGSFIISDELKTNEDKKEKVLGMMRREFKDMPNENELDICYLKEDNNINFIVYKKVKDEEATENVKERITIYKDLVNNDYYAGEHTVMRFHLSPNTEEVLIDEILCSKIDKENADYIINNANNNYSPYEIVIEEIELEEPNTNEKINISEPIIEVEIEDAQEKDEKPKEEYKIYYDLDNNRNIYVNKDFLEKFDIIPINEEVELEKEKYYQIDEDDAGKIINKHNKDYSIIEKEIHLGKKIDVIELTDNSSTEIIPLYQDENGCIYVTRYVINRFRFTPCGDAVRINGRNCFQLFDEDIEYLLENQNTGSYPYVVDYKSANFEEIEEKDEIVIYKDINNDNKLYASERVFYKFGLNTVGDAVMINNEECFPVDDDNLALIKEFVKKSFYSEVSINYIEVELGEKNNIQTKKDILKDIVEIISIEKKEEYKPIHMHASNKFKKDLTEESSYNVIYSIPNQGEVNNRFLNQLSKGLMSTKKAERLLDIIDKKLDELTDEELKQLKEEYNDSNNRSNIVSDIRRRIESVLK